MKYSRNIITESFRRIWFIRRQGHDAPPGRQDSTPPGSDGLPNERVRMLM